MTSRETTASGFLRRGRRWLSLASRDAVAGGHAVALESDRWFLGAIRTLESGVSQARQGMGAVSKELGVEWMQRRPKWLRQRTPRERIERLLGAEAKRHGFDIRREEFRSFSTKIAILLELVYTRTVPLEAIAFEPGGEISDDADALRSTPTRAMSERDASRAEASPSRGVPDASATPYVRPDGGR
jgi:hypothetical protein